MAIVSKSSGAFAHACDPQAPRTESGDPAGQTRLSHVGCRDRPDGPLAPQMVLSRHSAAPLYDVQLEHARTAPAMQDLNALRSTGLGSSPGRGPRSPWRWQPARRRAAPRAASVCLADLQPASGSTQSRPRSGTDRAGSAALALLEPWSLRGKSRRGQVVAPSYVRDVAEWCDTFVFCEWLSHPWAMGLAWRRFSPHRLYVL